MADETLWNPDAFQPAERKKLAAQTRAQFTWLESEIENLYQEFDKLTKKSAIQRITDLALENVNSAIGDAKELLRGDRSVDRIKPFVAAGENPVNSDVVLVLSKLTTALRRFQSTWRRAWNEISPSAIDMLLDEL